MFFLCRLLSNLLDTLKFLCGLSSLLTRPAKGTGVLLCLALSGALQNIYSLTGQPGLARALARLLPWAQAVIQATSSQQLLHLSLYVLPGAATQTSLGNNWINASDPCQKQAPGREGALAAHGDSTAPQSRGLFFTTTCSERITSF